MCTQVKQLDPGLHFLRLHRRVGQNTEVRLVAPGELLRDVVRRAEITRRYTVLFIIRVYLMCVDLFNIAL